MSHSVDILLEYNLLWNLLFSEAFFIKIDIWWNSNKVTWIFWNFFLPLFYFYVNKTIKSVLVWEWIYTLNHKNYIQLSFVWYDKEAHTIHELYPKDSTENFILQIRLFHPLKNEDLSNMSKKIGNFGTLLSKTVV